MDKKEIIVEARKQLELGIGRSISARGELALRFAVDNAYLNGKSDEAQRNLEDLNLFIEEVGAKWIKILLEETGYTAEEINKAEKDDCALTVDSFRKVVGVLRKPPLSSPSLKTGVSRGAD